jgi:hypothetical protein
VSDQRPASPVDVETLMQQVAFGKLTSWRNSVAAASYTGGSALDDRHDFGERPRYKTPARDVDLARARSLRAAPCEKGERWFKMNRRKNPARPAPRVSRSMPIEYFILANLRFEGPIVGYLASHTIHETVVDERGTRYRYVGLMGRDVDGRFDVNSLQPGEWIVQPGLIYAIEQPNAQSHT